MTHARQPHPVRLLLRDPRGGGPMVTFRSQVVRIGRDPACEVCFDDPKVSRVQCAIHCQGERSVLVVGQGRSPTLVNGSAASNVQLSKGDEIVVCGHVLVFDPDADDLARLRESATMVGSSGAAAVATDAPVGAVQAGAGKGAAPMPEISLDGLDDDDDDEDALDLEPLPPRAADPGEVGRPDDQHTRVLPKGASQPATPAVPPGAAAAAGGDDEYKTQVLPRGRSGGGPARRGTTPAQGVAAVGAAPGRGDGQHTQVLPKGKPAAAARAAGNQAVILADPAKGPPEDNADEIDPDRLSVAIQASQATDPGTGVRAPAKKGLLQNNAVRAALLLMMMALALLAWKDSLFPSKEPMKTTGRAITIDAPVIVGDRGGRSDEELLNDAQKLFAVGTKKLEEHHLQDENLTMAIRQLQQSEATLALLPTTPPLAGDVEAALREAEELRESKYRDALFHYQKLKRSGAYREGQDELTFIMRLIADESDPRYQDAARELAQIEEMMKDARR